MSNLFNSVQFKKPKQNKFNLSHERKMTYKMGAIVPTLLHEVMPGDKFKVNQEYLIRMQPLLAPIYHRLRVKTDFFYVPYRLIWDEFDKFISGGELGNDNPIAPHFLVDEGLKTYFQKGSLADYFGIPPITGTINQIAKISSLPFRAYALIYNEYYRDENLITKLIIPKTSGQESFAGANMNALTTLRMRAWEKDYFTSALPWAQKGGEVNIPTDIQLANAEATFGTPEQPAADGNVTTLGGLVKDSAGNNLLLKTIESLGITINNLRTSARLQEWLEKNARAGSRLAEFILAHFGVVSDDLRLGRPQYLGGHSNPISISEVLSTFQAADDQGDPIGFPQGQMAGHAISAGAGAGFKGYFKEHGLVFGLTTVLPKTGYNQGIPRMFSRFDKFDYPFPTFAHLGEQEVKLRELYFNPNVSTNEGEETFGYQSRYADWKFQPNTTHGDFRDNLAFWHMDRIFSSKPVLNESFVTSNPTNRIFNVQDQTDQVLCNVYNSVSVIRSLPYFSNPKL